MAGKARQTSVEMPVTIRFLRPVALTASTTRLSSHALTVVRSMIGAPCRTSARLGIRGPHIFSIVVVTITGTLSATIALVRPTMLGLSYFRLANRPRSMQHKSVGRLKRRRSIFGDCVEFGDYVRRKFQPCSIEILSKMVYRRCAGYQQNVRRTLKKPGKRHLHWSS